MANLRVVLDTNVLVSGLLYPVSGPGRIVASWRQGSLDVVLSQAILDELTRVLPRFDRLQWDEQQVRTFVDSLRFFTDLVEPDGGQDSDLRDPFDQVILATFRAAQAQYLVSGDKDLLALAHRYPILSPAAFLARHA
jgi:putative PIN family toxin of toxin-antitoxin system